MRADWLVLVRLISLMNWVLSERKECWVETEKNKRQKSPVRQADCLDLHTFSSDFDVILTSWIEIELRTRREKLYC